MQRRMFAIELKCIYWPKYANLEKIFYLNFEIFLHERKNIKEKEIKEKNKLFFKELPLC